MGSTRFCSTPTTAGFCRSCESCPVCWLCICAVSRIMRAAWAWLVSPGVAAITAGKEVEEEATVDAVEVEVEEVVLVMGLPVERLAIWSCMIV